MPIEAALAQRQTVGMAPEHLVGKAVLKMGLQDLCQFVRSEMAENPALAIEDGPLCPICGSSLIGQYCPICGSEMLVQPGPLPDEPAEWLEQAAGGESPDEWVEPFSFIAAPSRLTDHLKEQINTNLPREHLAAAEFIVDCLDEDGYLREPLFDIAARLSMSVPELESVLSEVQGLDPPGIAARNLRECLLIQLRRSCDCSEQRRDAERILLDCWTEICRMKIDAIGKRLGLERRRVESALKFIRRTLSPYPASMFRDPWQTMAPRTAPRLVPDVIIRHSDLGLVPEVVDPFSGRASIEETYAILYEEMCRKTRQRESSAHPDPAEQAHVRESVLRARALIEALEFRKITLRRLSEELVRCQADFFTLGPSALKPMRKKDLARRIGMHESTICRATQNKTLQMPTGEVVSFDVLFDPGLSVKELVRELALQRLTDGQIAERLASSGINIARRTVAKYRDQLRVLALEYRSGIDS